MQVYLLISAIVLMLQVKRCVLHRLSLHVVAVDEEEGEVEEVL
jgi:hypothetical protein